MEGETGARLPGVHHSWQTGVNEVKEVEEVKDVEEVKEVKEVEDAPGRTM